MADNTAAITLYEHAGFTRLDDDALDAPAEGELRLVRILEG